MDELKDLFKKFKVIINQVKHLLSQPIRKENEKSVNIQRLDLRVCIEL